MLRDVGDYTDIQQFVAIMERGLPQVAANIVIHARGCWYVGRPTLLLLAGICLSAVEARDEALT